MSGFQTALQASPEYRTLLQAVQTRRQPLGVLGLSGAQKAILTDALCGALSRKALLVLPEEAAATKLTEDLQTLGLRAFLYPARDFAFRSETEGRSHEYEQRRLQALTALLDGTADVVVCAAEAAVQRTVPPDVLRRHARTVRKGGEMPLAELLETLTASGYERCDAVEGVGQFSARGGIVDIFSPGFGQPVRIELFGDTVESIAAFDAASQRRTQSLTSFSLMPGTELLLPPGDVLADKLEALAGTLKGKQAAKQRETLYADADRLRGGAHMGCADKFLPLIYETVATVFDYLPENGLLLVLESAGVRERAANAAKLFAEDFKACLADGTLCRGLDKFYLTEGELFRHYEQKGALYVDNFARGSFDTPVRELVTFTATQLPVWNGQLDVLCEDLSPVLQKDAAAVVFGGTEKAAKTLAEDLAAEGLPAVYFPLCPNEFSKGHVTVLPGALSGGFCFPHEKFYVYTYGRTRLQASRRRHARFQKGQSLHSLDDLKKGDYVVHAAHGIGIFDGIQKLEVGKITKDYIKIRYAKGDVLYVPVTQLDLVSKYIGPHEETGRTIKLNRIGGAEWEKTRSRVRAAVKDMADQLIALYAKRQSMPGYAFSPDIDMQNDFERRFPYEETADQLRAADEIKGDMEKPYPMDRLLCGDVGFGKTEVALRAAFKCVADGKQCAVLVPTTILALQHYRTILNRFEGFPVNVEMISRFRTPRQQEQILKGLRRGSIDLVVGTHRLVSKDVQFKDLGLLIVDEEQRFGVAQKEKLKELFPAVDVLTLSATPIPRTLNMAMTGIRDMSVIEEAPQDRYPVQTYVVEFDMGLLAQAMEKELRRGGQVYFLHNRVETIDKRANEIAALLPGARIAVAHGKMPEEKLSDIWRRLLEGEIDILVCTTIIETGVDVPNCNTLIIEDADRLGLAQLHQIRGRVGRSTRRASAYFTFTRGKELTDVAARRLSAIREYTEFGSGFKIAMRDLEIRGAGSVLGAQQHGHMEAVGYDMYLQLLGEAVSAEKGEKSPVRQKECLVDMQVDAHIPERYIESLPQRLAMYRRIADIRSEEDAADVRDELRDRFGEIPRSVEGLMEVSLLRNAAADLGIYEIGQKGQAVILYMKTLDTSMVLNLSSAMRGRVSVADTGKKHIAVKIADREQPLDTLREIFGYLTV